MISGLSPHQALSILKPKQMPMPMPKPTRTWHRPGLSALALRALCCAVLGLLTNVFALTLVHAKLPALSDEAKAKAAEAAALTAHNGKIANFQLCKSMDRVADRYKADAKKAGKPVTPAPDGTACVDPGPFVYVPPVALPVPGAPLASAAPAPAPAPAVPAPAGAATPASPAPAAAAPAPAAAGSPAPAAAAKK